MGWLALYLYIVGVSMAVAIIITQLDSASWKYWTVALTALLYPILWPLAAILTAWEGRKDDGDDEPADRRPLGTHLH